MMNGLRLAAAILCGVVVGALVNGGLIGLGPSLIPPPAGVDMTTVEGLEAGMKLLEPKHFIMPFLAHALGTLVGAIVAALIAPASRLVVAMVIGCVFLAGGIAASTMIPAPTWFIALDLIAAYLPMAWVGARLSHTIRQ